MADRTVGWHYEQARLRIDDLVRPLPPAELDLAVPACPGWRVRDVIAHLVGNTEDGAAGRITGVPDEEMTREQVERHATDPVSDLLDLWASASPFVADAITASGRWPAAIDAVTHEHDLRAALGRAGARDHESVSAFARLLGEHLATMSTPVAADLGAVVVGDPSADLRLRTTPFELFRLRMGRRSRAQVRALDWSSDPTAILPELFVFGPAETDLHE